MFDNESLMVTKLNSYFKKKYLTFSEIGVGYGVADLVIVRNVSDFMKFIKNRNGVYLNHIDHIKIFTYILKRQGVTFSQVYNEHFISKRRLKYDIIRFLLECGAVYESNQKYYRNPKFKLFCPKVTAIEAKLQDWRQGLSQAIRYQRFATKSYLAIDHDYVHRVNLEELMSFNIGLLSVGDKVVEIFNPLDKPPLDMNMRYRISEEIIASTIKLNDGNVSNI